MVRRSGGRESNTGEIVKSDGRSGGRDRGYVWSCGTSVLDKVEEAGAQFDRLLEMGGIPCKAACNAMIWGLYAQDRILEAFDYLVRLNEAGATAVFSLSIMDSDFIERLQRINLTSEEEEVITVRSDHREKILEECNLNLIGHLFIEKPINLHAAKNLLSPEGDRVWVAFQYERLLGLCFNCDLLGHEAKVCTMSRIGEGKESPYGDWLRVGFFWQKGVRGQRIPSPPRRNMEEHICQDKNPLQSNSKPGVLHGNSLTAATVIEPRTSNGNSSIAIMVIEIVYNELAIIPRLDGYDSQLPCTSEINERNPEIMVHTDVIGIEHKTEKKMMTVGSAYQLCMRKIWWIILCPFQVNFYLT
nr:hypothetical protein CFP56_57765 [Quercus suber]